MAATAPNLKGEEVVVFSSCVSALGLLNENVVRLVVTGLDASAVGVDADTESEKFDVPNFIGSVVLLSLGLAPN